MDIASYIKTFNGGLGVGTAGDEFAVIESPAFAKGFYGSAEITLFYNAVLTTSQKYTATVSYQTSATGTGDWSDPIILGEVEVVADDDATFSGEVSWPLNLDPLDKYVVFSNLSEVDALADDTFITGLSVVFGNSAKIPV